MILNQGGAIKTDVLILEDKTLYPKAISADIYPALGQKAFDKYMKFTNEKQM